jgi:hypothetical protein
MDEFANHLHTAIRDRDKRIVQLEAKLRAWKK